MWLITSKIGDWSKVNDTIILLVDFECTKYPPANRVVERIWGNWKLDKKKNCYVIRNPGSVHSGKTKLVAVKWGRQSKWK